MRVLVLSWVLSMCGVLGVSLYIWGLFWGLFLTPSDYVQGEVFRILYLHVPYAWLSLSLYVVLCVVGVLYCLKRGEGLGRLLLSTARVGCMSTFLCLVTGSIWGRFTWGWWWVWDGRLTSVLVLFFLYIVVLLIPRLAIGEKGLYGASVIGILGGINLPIIKFSVEWWNTLHQGASVVFRDLSSSTISYSMLLPLLVVALGLYGLGIFLVFGSAFNRTFLWRMRFWSVVVLVLWLIGFFVLLGVGLVWSFSLVVLSALLLVGLGLGYLMMGLLGVKLVRLR